MPSTTLPPGAPPEQWTSRTGFVLATIASAIGLGNIWRFAYVAGDHGGGSFLVVYVACVLLVGLPIMLAEFAIGARARADIVVAFEGERAARAWRWAGWLIALGAFAILSYYSVVAGWTLRYLVDYVAGPPPGVEAIDAGREFAAFLATPSGPLGWHLLFMGLTMAVVALGVQRGIEIAARVLMPLLAALVLLLAAYSLSLGGAAQAIAFLFSPDWSRVADPGTVTAALGQAFFSLGVGMGVLATYAAYAGSNARLGTAAVTIAAADTAFAIVAGLAIFPAVFAFGADPAQGPALAFVTLPQVFARMPGGTWFAVAFFFLLAAAALTSAVSLLEVPVALAMRRLGLSRRVATIAVGSAAGAAGVPSALGFNVLDGVRPLGRPILDAVDFIAAELVLPLGGLAIALFAGWVLPRDALLRALGSAVGAGAAARVAGAAFHWSLRWLAPVGMLAVLAARLLASAR